MTSSKSLTKERFLAAIKLARVMLSAEEGEQLQEFYRSLVRVDFSTESKQGLVTFYLPLPCEEFQLDSPRIYVSLLELIPKKNSPWKTRGKDMDIMAKRGTNRELLSFRPPVPHPLQRGNVGRFFVFGVELRVVDVRLLQQLVGQVGHLLDRRRDRRVG